MSEIALLLKSLKETHTRPLVGYRPGDALTHVLLNQLADHALKVFLPDHIDQQRQRATAPYNVLLLSQPHEQDLESHVEKLATTVPEPYRRWMPDVHAYGPTLMDLRRPSKRKWNAVVASTFLEHEENAMGALIFLHDRLEDNGCLMLVGHVPGSGVAEAIEQDAVNLENAFRALQRYARQDLSRRHAASQLEEFGFKQYIKSRAMNEWLERFKNDPDAKRVVNDALRQDAFQSPRAVARRIKERALWPKEWAPKLIEAGFHMHTPLAFEVGRKGHAVILLPAYKGICPDEV